jgi:hypothetical protein
MEFRKRAWRCCPLVLTLFCLIASGQMAETRTATVHLKLVDFRGEDLGNGTVQVFRDAHDESKKNLASQFSANTAQNVVFGTYLIRVYKKSFSASERTILVNQPNVWAVIQLYVGEENGPLTYTVAGKVVGSSSTGDPVWIRATGLYSSIIADTQMSKDGTFQFELPGGAYVVTTRSGTHVMDTRTIALPSQHQTGVIVPLEIKLP